MMAQWAPGSGDGAGHVAWARAFYDALEPNSKSHLLNFQSEPTDDVIRAS